MAFLEIARGLYTKSEAVAGTPADPLDKANNYTNPEKIEVRIRELDVSIDPEIDDENSKYLTGDFTGDESIIGKIPGSVSYSIKFAPGQFNKDALNDASEHLLNYGSFLESSGLNKIVITDDSVPTAEYSYPQKYLFYPSTQASSKTLSQTVVDKNNEGYGIGYDITGSINNLTLAADGVGSPFSFSFEGQGGVNDVYEISQANMAKLKFDGADVMETIASKYLDTVVRITDLSDDSFVEVCTNKFELNSGNTLSEVECQASASGILYNTITGMEPRVMLNPDMKRLSEFDFFESLTTEKTYRIEVTVSDKNAADGNVFEPLKIVITRAQMLSAPVVADNGFMRNDITFRPLGNRDKYVPTVTYQSANDGTEVAFDFDGTSLDGSENEATYFIIISEEYFKDI